MALRDLHLADLHEKARELGIPRYRLLARGELIEAIERGEQAPPTGGEPAGPEAAEGEAERRRGRRRGRRGRRGRGRGEGAAREEATAEDATGEEAPTGEEVSGEGIETFAEVPPAEDITVREGAEPEQPSGAEAEQKGGPEPEQVSGVLDRMPQGYGFLRLQGLEAAEGDVYVSASQIRRCELRTGDEVSGPARAPRRGERHRALVRVESVNGHEPEGGRTQFEDLTPVAPDRRLPLGGEGVDPLVRAVDLLTPLAFGQRVLIVAEPRSGRTTLLRALARAIEADGGALTVLLPDERPEEVTAWRDALPAAELVAAPADQEPVEQTRAAELALGRAKRRVEAGEDVILIIDSISRLALGYRDPGRVKRLFGAGRELSEEGTGSLTVVATVLDSDEIGTEVRTSLETTENVLLRLDAGLAAEGVFPSLLVAECRESGEETLRDPEELDAVRALRRELSELSPADAARALAERIEATASNEELLSRL